MIRIKELTVLDDKKIHFRFSNNTEKNIDFSSFIKEDKMSKPLSDRAYFKQVKLYENGRGIYWPNGYDFCPDFLQKYQPEDREEPVGEK